NREYQKRKKEKEKEILAMRNNLVAIDYERLDINPENWKLDDINMSSMTHWLTRLKTLLNSKITVKETDIVKRYFTLGKYKCDEASNTRKELEDFKLWGSLFTFFRKEIIQKVEENLKKENYKDRIYSITKKFLYDESNRNIL